MRGFVVVGFALTMMGCGDRPTRVDLHSYAQPHLARVRHLALDLEVWFGQRQLVGNNDGVHHPVSGQAGHQILQSNFVQSDV